MATPLQTRAEEQFQSQDGLRVLFFFDPEETFRAEVDAWDHDRIRCLIADAALFRLKYRLEHELAETRVLLYVPHRRPEAESGYVLADVLAANRELRVDRVAEFMDTFALPARHRDVVQRYFKGELEYKNRQRFLSSILTAEGFSEKALKRGLAAYHLESADFRTVPRDEQLLAGLFLQAAAGIEGFAAYRQTCEALDLTDTLERLLGRQFALETPTLSLDTLRTAAQKMKYNLLMRSVNEEHPDDPYRQRLGISSTLVLSQLGGVANAWRETSALPEAPERVLDTLAPEIDEEKLLDVYGSDTTFGYVTPTLRKRRIQEAAEQLADQPSRAKATVADLSEEASPTADAAEAVWHMASFYQVLSGYQTLDLGAPDDFVDAYTEELYQCDTHYRKAVGAFQRVQMNTPVHEPLLRSSYDAFLRDYHEAFVHPLNTAWQRVLERRIQEGSGDLQVARQGTFYADRLAGQDQKVAVVISDALRFEAAQELADRLAQADARKLSTLQPMLAALPTITPVGMAHLLPHRTIETSSENFVIDGCSTAGTRNRERILQSASPDARALRLNDLNQLDEREGRDLFKDHPLVYVYHDRIDAVGDDRKTERDTLSAVEKALIELRAAIRMLNNWNVYRVLVTADHGFLYSEGAPPASMQESFPPSAHESVLRRSRCFVTDASSSSSSGYRFRLGAVSDISSDLEVRVPRAVNRYRLQGAGKRFAHGGASLQEMLVPALEVRKVRQDRAEKVDVRLLSEKRVIRSGALNVQVLQAQAVSSSRQARTVRLGLYDEDGQPVSGEETLTLDETASDPTARTQKVLLTLGPDAKQLNFCRLQAFDESDHNRLAPLVDQRYSIQRLIEQDDF